LVRKSLLENIVSMVIYGTISLAVKNIAVSSGEIAFWRVSIALVALLTYKLIRREKLPLKQAKGDLLWLGLSGIAIGGDWILFFEAYKYTSVSVTTLSYYFCPVIVMVLSPIIFREHITARQWLCFIMASFGLVLIIGARTRGSDSELIGIALGLAAALCYAIIILINKRIKNVSGINKTIFQFIAALLVLAVYVPFTSGFDVSGLDIKGLLCLGVLGLVHTAFAYSLYFTSIQNLTGQRVALLGYIDPLVAVVVSVLFLKESITLWQLVGGLMIIGFTVLNELGAPKADKATIRINE